MEAGRTEGSRARSAVLSVCHPHCHELDLFLDTVVIEAAHKKQAKHLVQSLVHCTVSTLVSGLVTTVVTSLVLEAVAMLVVGLT